MRLNSSKLQRHSNFRIRHSPSHRPSAFPAGLSPRIVSLLRPGQKCNQRYSLLTSGKARHSASVLVTPTKYDSLAKVTARQQINKLIDFQLPTGLHQMHQHASEFSSVAQAHELLENDAHAYEPPPPSDRSSKQDEVF